MKNKSLNTSLSFSKQLALDQLNPIERLSHLATFEKKYLSLSLSQANENNENHANFCEILLLSLGCINEILQKYISSQFNFYIYGDQSLQFLLNHFFKNQYSSSALKENLLLLKMSDTIFRFTCAKKFCILNVNAKQFRINGWGLAYIKENDLRINYKNYYTHFSEICSNQILRNIDKYQLLGKLLTSEITKNSSSKIAVLNKALPLKLLS